jgi:hypothetical protein
MKDHVICIIGMHRSGTSMVAQLLHQARLFLGSADQLLRADSSNQDGHFEHLGFLKINGALLRHFGGSWEFPPDLEPGWETYASLAELRSSARALLETFSGKLPWGWKEPRTTILLPFWRSVIPNLRFVICVRSPLEVAKSLAKRNKIPIERGVFLWNRYMRAAIQDTESCPRIFAYYEDFFTDAVSEANRLISFCGLQAPQDPSMLGGEIRSELRHHRSEITELLGAASIPAEYKLLYVGLRALSERSRVATTPPDESAQDASEFLRVLDEFHDYERLAQLQTELTKRNYELSKLRNEMLNDLKANHAWAYRIYRKFIRPFRSS